ncbi:MAG: hypothetical protein KDA25_07495 [Phycisphaerales bacterium]|nr:hypothetical protein [Phycisphaerales bacterium]
MRRLVSILLVASWCVPILSGCRADDAPPLRGTSSTGPGVDMAMPAEAPPTAAPVAWPFEPAAMRLHPLTRFVRESSGQWVIEARVLCTDADGVTTRAIGTMTLVIYGCDGFDENAVPLMRWDVDLGDLAVNRQRFDASLLMYLFRLGTDAEALPACVMLDAALRTPDGRVLRPESPVALRR